MKFYKCIVEEVENENVLMVANAPYDISDRTEKAIKEGKIALADRMQGQETCEECGHDKWLILPPLLSFQFDSGKPLIQCRYCGFTTHL